ncbi:MAG: prolipoprotein diacylglyceryl transferase [Gammaproteobacteria bacterium]|nr:prolipoprotein diacylglyceryl transferase [Gammaproteobacteria bacterium]
MLIYPDIDPVAVQLGPFKVHWYGLMYLIGFAAAWWLGRRRLRLFPGLSPQDLSDLIFYAALGVILGGRLGYILFYDFSAYLAEPLNILKIWQGGMSFHGGLLGVIAAMALFARRRGRRFFEIADFTAPLIPIGLGAGRLGNFINGELWGRVSDLPWAMVFPDPRAGGLPRHPSQLYEMLLEGVLLFVVLWLYARKPRPPMAVSALFLLGYGAFRFLVEFARTPDEQLGFIAAGWLTMGQLLCLPMLATGAVLWWLAHRNDSTREATLR